MPNKTAPTFFRGGPRDREWVHIHLPLSLEVRFEEPVGTQASRKAAGRDAPPLTRYSRYALKRDEHNRIFYDFIEEGVF